MAAAPRLSRSDAVLRGVALLAGVTFFARLWEGSFSSDPALYASVAKGMAEGGDWLAMQVGSSPYHNKPPLLFWITAALFRLFGTSTFTACFASAFFGAATCVAVYRLGRELFDHHIGLLAACVLMGTFDFVHYATRFRLESASACFLVLALTDAARAVRAERAQPLARAGAWIGLCFMSKGGPGFLAAAVVLAHLVACRKGRLLLTRPAAIGAVWLLALALLWPAIQWLRFGDAYVEQAIGAQLVHRIFGSRAYHPGRYLEHIGLQYWPWLPLLGYGAWRLARGTPSQGRRLLGVWIALLFAYLSLPDPKYARYLSSGWPAFALVTAHGIAPLLGAARIERLGAALPRLAAALAVLLVCLPIRVHTDRAEPVRRLGTLLEAYQPGSDTVVAHPVGRMSWRAQFHFYLDRDLEVVKRREDLEKHPARIVLSRRSAGAALERAGWRKLIDAPHWNAYLRP